MQANRAAAVVLRAAQALQADPLMGYSVLAPGAGGMSPPQLAFHSSQSRKRALIAANKIGKSYAGAAESWFHMLGSHPFRSVPAPGSEGWLLSPDLITGWRTISKAMHELQPPGVLDPSCRYVAGVGYMYRGLKIVRVSAKYGGGLLVGKGCCQSVLSLEGARIQYSWVDEPPKMQHFQGLRARLAMDLGPLWVTATPIGRPVGWFRNLIEGNSEENIDPEKGWDVSHIELNHENAPHRTPADIEAQRNECSPWEFNQRILSQWEGLSEGRWVTGFTEENLFEDSEAPEHVEALGLGWDHGELPGKSICYLVAWDGHTVWVLGEYSNTDRSTPIEEAREVLKMMKAWGVAPHEITDARGDSNSAGRLGMGFSMNEVMGRAFASLAETSRPPFRISVPYKGRGSVNARVRLISNACVDGRLRVHVKCSRLIHTLRHWRGSNNSEKDAFDGMGYISEVYLSPSLQSGSGRLIIS